MLDLKLKDTGKMTLRSGGIELHGFEADGASCRDVAVLALIWAIGELQAELTNIVTEAGGSGICSVD